MAPRRNKHLPPNPLLMQAEAVRCESSVRDKDVQLHLLYSADPVGRAKPATMVLPGEGHTYGVTSKIEGDGAGAVIGGWVEHAPNEKSMPGRDFKKLNRMALVQGSGSNTAQIAEFRRHHDARLHTGHGHKQDPRFAYGAKSGDRTDMDAVMTQQYLKEFVAEQEKKEDQYHSESKRIPVMHTKASLGHRYVEPIPDDSIPFKMKKFANVPARLHMPGR